MECSIRGFCGERPAFEGVGVDGVYLHFHKAHEFIGMKGLPTFIANDVIKDPKIEEYTENYKNHLDKVFNK